MTQRALRARMYLPLSRLTSRSTYVFGLIVATGILRILSFLLMLLLAASYHSHTPGLGIQDATIANMLPGAIGVLLYTILLSTLTILLSPPVATRGMQICFLAWLAVVLYSNTGPGLMAHYLSVVGIPLTPIAACYNISVTGALDVYGFIMFLLMFCFIAGLCWLCAYCFKQRDLIVH
jgi:hypothetical protein